MGKSANIEEGALENPGACGESRGKRSEKILAPRLQDKYLAEVQDVAGVIRNLGGLFETWIPANLYAQTLTWMAADVANNSIFNGDLKKALGAIDIPFLMMPCATDMYFRVEDNENYLSLIRSGNMAVIPSISGHMAGMPGFNSEDDALIDQKPKDFIGA